jgi:hypothetical protein
MGFAGSATPNMHIKQMPPTDHSSCAHVGWTLAGKSGVLAWT